MDGYVMEVIDEADAKLKTKQRGQANTHASMALFKINRTSPELNKNEADHYRTMTAKLLFLAPRASPDLLTDPSA